MKRTLIFNFDGTRNGASDEFPTNVRKMALAFSDMGQLPLYFPGPGDEDDNGFFGRLFGSAVGFGCRAIVNQAIQILKVTFREGDKIAVTGFSRGSSIARMFCFEVGKLGYEVEFLGVFDTVAAFLPFGKFQQDTLFGDLHVSACVKQACHAVAMHEDREAFTPNLMNIRTGVNEVWFKGNHADIGGGYEETGLSDITLGWMVGHAMSCGLKFDVVPLRRENPSQDFHYEEGFWRRGDRWIGVMDGDGKTLLKPDIHATAC